MKASATDTDDDTTQDYIQPCEDDPTHWEYDGEPVLLLGGSWQDNLFNHPENLEEHLDLLVSVGGNYVRNVMSHRNEGNVFAYARDGDHFDLDRFDDEYWTRFETFLELTHERDIVVQIEIWATHDHYADHQSLGGWSYHPFNPANNVTYTPEESGLPTIVDYPPASEPTDHPFFHTVPALEDNELLLGYQRTFVDTLLSHSLDYPHVLYCMNNETGEPVEWSDYWAEYVRQRAEDVGVTIQTTEMRRNEEVRAEDHAHIYENPDRYTFLDISQNNAWEGIGQKHFDNIEYVREYTAEDPRPINNVKNYGSIRHGEEESVARFCRIVFAGCASARFHRPHPLEDPDEHEAATEVGLGLSPRAQRIIESMRKLTDEIDLLEAEPRNDLLGDREPNEAYLLDDRNDHHAVYFPDGGSVTVDRSDAENDLDCRWIDIDAGEWVHEEKLDPGPAVRLTAPDSGHWAVLVTG